MIKERESGVTTGSKGQEGAQLGRRGAVGAATMEQQRSNREVFRDAAEAPPPGIPLAAHGATAILGLRHRPPATAPATTTATTVGCAARPRLVGWW